MLSPKAFSSARIQAGIPADAMRSPPQTQDVLKEEKISWEMKEIGIWLERVTLGLSAPDPDQGTEYPGPTTAEISL